MAAPSTTKRTNRNRIMKTAGLGTYKIIKGIQGVY